MESEVGKPALGASGNALVSGRVAALRRISVICCSKVTGVP